MPYLLGVDIGSSEMKATLIDEDRGYIKNRTVSYEQNWIGEKPEYLERDVEVYWVSFKKIVSQFISKDHISSADIQAISFSVQGETFVPVDEQFRPLRKTIQGHDVRAQEEVKILREKFGDLPLYPVSGQPAIDGYWLAVKILWLKRHQPEIFALTRHYMLLEDYIIHRLTGRFVTDKTIIADSYFYDMRSQDWYSPMMDYLGLTEEMMPTVLDPCEPVGTVSAKISQETGLASKTVVVAGAMDQIAGAIGAGNIKPGVITETTGTALAIGVTGNGKLEEYTTSGLPVLFHAVKDAYFLMPWLGSGGLTLQWFAQNLSENGKHDFKALTTLAEKIPAGAEGLIMLPFLVGATCPEFDSSARGVFFGITPGHTRGHFVRAILEAIGYAIRANLDLIRTIGIPVSCIRSLGGGSKSRLWNQIKADVCGIEISSMDVEDAASLGAALMAGVGVKAYESLETTAASRFIRTKEIFYPDCTNKNVYDEGYRKYRQIYTQLKNIF